MRTRAVNSLVIAVTSVLLLGACSTDSGVSSGRAAPTGTGSTATTTSAPATTTTTAPGTTVPTTTTTDPPEEDTPVPVDPDVRVVTLDNGLTVYLRHNERPGLHAELRLVVDAGSAVEEADQSGVAHFLEHMLFNGTERFPANELVATLRGFGMDLGPDVNAYTSYDETVYELSVPLSDPGNLDLGLDVLHEWLTAATLDPTQVTNERGVVLDEWRGSQNLQGRIGDTIIEMFLGASQYDGRQPIGIEAAISAMTPEPLRRFYDRWYRPDNVAVVVVGDIDVDDTEQAIRDRFDAVQPRGDTTAHDPFPISPFADTVAVVQADPDATDVAAELTLPAPNDAVGMVNADERDLMQELAFDMIATRLTDDIARGTASFTSAFVSNNDLVRVIDAPSVVVRGESADHAAAVAALAEEFERVRRFGFGEGELHRAVAEARAAADGDFERKDTTQDGEYVDRYIGHFLSGAAIPSAEWTYEWLTGVFDSVTPDDVAGVLVDRMASAAAHLLVVVPDTLADPPTEAGLLAVLESLPDVALEPRDDITTPTDGLMTAPEPVVEAERTNLAFDQFSFLEPLQLTFPNGARVILNVTPIVDATVSFDAVSPGGLSLVDDADVPEALIATSVVGASGVGDLDPVQLDTVLGATSVEVSPYLEPVAEGFNGGASSGDLEPLFQYVHLLLAEPRFDQAGLDTTLGWLRPYVEDPSSDPSLATYLAYTDIRYGGEPRYGAYPRPGDLDDIDLATVEKVWRARFSNVSDWTFALSGDFDLDEAIDLARRYIGPLAGTGTTETFVDRQPDPPLGVAERLVTAGTGDQGSLTVVYTAASTDPATDRVLCDLLGAVLTARLTDDIREELGASYSPNAFCAVETEPDATVETVVQITGDPAGMTELAGIVQLDLAGMRSDGPTDEAFAAGIADLTDQYDLFSNELLLEALVRAPQHPEELEGFIDRRATLQGIDLAALRAFIARVLPGDRYIAITTLPG